MEFSVVPCRGVVADYQWQRFSVACVLTEMREVVANVVIVMHVTLLFTSGATSELIRSHPHMTFLTLWALRIFGSTEQSANIPSTITRIFIVTTKIVAQH